MRIKVKRKAKASWHSEWVNEVKNAARFAAANFNLSHHEFKVDFILKNDPSVDYAGVTLTLSPLKRFVIILNAAYVKSSDHILRLVFHEMTHIKQEFHDGLVMDDTDEAHYKGMVYSFDEQCTFRDAYYHLPWEVEARESEKILLKKYKRCLTV